MPEIPHESDKHVVAAAIHEGAQVIVTSNLKHFPQEMLAPHRILVQSPDDFLIHQYHLNPDVVAEKIDTQASAIGQQRSAFLDLLARTETTLFSITHRFSFQLLGRRSSLQPEAGARES